LESRSVGGGNVKKEGVGEGRGICGMLLGKGTVGDLQKGGSWQGEVSWPRTKKKAHGEKKKG